MDVGRLLLLVGVLVPSVILHEVAHGVVALWFGDDTAKRAGRLTVNPVAHVDPFGTLLLPAMLALAGGGVFGYAKPVPVDHRKLRRPRDHGLVVSLAGPATNILLAVLAALVLRWLGTPGVVGVATGETAARIVTAFGVVNVVLAAFNLIPLPPLDGSAVIERLLPRAWLPGWLRLRRWSMLIVLGAVLLIPGVFSRVFDVALRLWVLLL